VGIYQQHAQHTASKGYGKHHSKTNIVVVIVGRVVVAIRTARVPLIVDPGTAAQDE